MSNPLCEDGRMKKRNAHPPVKLDHGNPSSRRMARSQNQPLQDGQKPVLATGKRSGSGPQNDSKMAKLTEIETVTHGRSR
jgi:hypothetical protein